MNAEEKARKLLPCNSNCFTNAEYQTFHRYDCPQRYLPDVTNVLREAYEAHDALAAENKRLLNIIYDAEARGALRR